MFCLLKKDYVKTTCSIHYPKKKICIFGLNDFAFQFAKKMFPFPPSMSFADPLQGLNMVMEQDVFTDYQIYVSDNDKQKLCGWHLLYNRYLPIQPEDIVKNDFDMIFIATGNDNYSLAILNQLIGYGIDRDKIDVLGYSRYFNSMREGTDARVGFIRNLSQAFREEKIVGACAELGVFRGNFAYFIRNYYEGKLYLFDTFTGFQKDSFEKEAEHFGQEFNTENEYFNKEVFERTNVELVMNRFTAKQKETIVIRQGYFPDAAENIDDKFCFVNLDPDSYEGVLSGLQFFYNKMVLGGVILIHDYYATCLPGVRLAVADFEKEIGNKLFKFPIGDNSSIAIKIL